MGCKIPGVTLVYAHAPPGLRAEMRAEEQVLCTSGHGART